MINIKAKSSWEFFPGESVLVVTRRLRFLTRCIDNIPEVNFADGENQRAYARFNKVEFSVVDTEVFNQHMKDCQRPVLFMEITPKVLQLELL